MLVALTALDADLLTNILTDNLSKIGLDITKLVSQCYDI
jgi:hypothetical protein